MSELRGRAFLAWLFIAIGWGATFPAMRVGVVTIPPFLLAGIRFGSAGLLLLAGALLAGARLPTRPRDWGTLALVGCLLLASGNGVVVWASQYVDSGSASIYVAAVALWSACFDALVPGGTTPFTWQLATGLGVGLLGTAILTGVTPRTLFHTDLRGPLALLGASASWSWGTIYLKRHPVAVGSGMAAALQMLIGGLALFLVATLRHEWPGLHPSQGALVALAYLVVFGSILGYTAWAYALRHASATVVGTYAYVNPVVAVLIGWLYLGEPLTPRKLVAMAVVIGAVVWIHKTVSGKR